MLNGKMRDSVRSMIYPSVDAVTIATLPVRRLPLLDADAEAILRVAAVMRKVRVRIEFILLLQPRILHYVPKRFFSCYVMLSLLYTNLLSLQIH